jgi:ribosome-interacting GTPase 1
MLRNGAKIENVSRMLGHTNITQTQRYAKVLAQSVHEEFERVAAKMGTAALSQCTERQEKKRGKGQ